MSIRTDTSPEIAEMVRSRLMALSGVERVRMESASFDAARAMVFASLPADLTDADLKRRLYQRIYGEPSAECSESECFAEVRENGRRGETRIARMVTKGGPARRT